MKFYRFKQQKEQINDLISTQEKIKNNALSINDWLKSGELIEKSNP